MRAAPTERLEASNALPGHVLPVTTGLWWRWSVACSVMVVFQFTTRVMALHFSLHWLAITIIGSLFTGLAYAMAMTRLRLMTVAAPYVPWCRRWGLLPPERT